MSDHTNLRERLAYALYRSAIDAGLETSALDYALQRPDYHKFADELLSRIFFVERPPDALRHHLPLEPQSDARPDRW